PLTLPGRPLVLRVQVRNKSLDTCHFHDSGPFELGRGPRREVERCIVDDPMVSRNQLRLEEVDGLVQVENLSHTNPVFVLTDGSRIDTGASRRLAPPLTLCVGNTTVLIQLDQK